MNKEAMLGALLFAGIVGYASLGFEILETLPNRARVLVDYLQDEYATIPCVVSGNVTYPYVLNLEEMRDDGVTPVWSATVEIATMGDVRANGYNPDAKCADAGGFVTPRTWLYYAGFGEERVDREGRILW